VLERREHALPISRSSGTSSSNETVVSRTIGA
jgi:hypothetical protein